ncbi:MAG: tRNA 2-thiouridine(34) synthase MnmA [Candidatus Kerfeldbacteria bacterium]|nr:tRNA 2-thiouridine(34) synthase MnmA [Candidatus Kerfeldbacteria bacterium]
MRQNRVIVAMSGGVDSSVTAKLLKQEGFDVVGVFMKNWSGVISPDGMECSYRQDREDALRVAAQLDIPLQTWDFEQEYRKYVFSYFLSEYKKGRTPNPDIVCNQWMKFRFFVERALKIGDWVATGHYARVTHRGKRTRVFRGKDSEKDQSYFLCRVQEQQLSRVLFPLGTWTKRDVRAFAKRSGIPTFDKPDSQGLCFVGEVPLQDFLSMYIAREPGDVVDADTREIVGTHQGLAFYTIGQRHGVPSHAGLPYYVIQKNLRANTLVVVAGNNHPRLFTHRFLAHQPLWIGPTPRFPFRCMVQVRYRQEPQRAVVSKKSNGLVIETLEPQRAITPAQFVAFYRRDELLGSAVIRSS